MKLFENTNGNQFKLTKENIEPVSSKIQNATLDVLTKKVKKLNDESLAFEKIQLDIAIELGEHLIDVKHILNHGEFLPWLKTNLISNSTAGRYMMLAKSKNRLTGVKNLRQAYILLKMVKSKL